MRPYVIFTLLFTIIVITPTQLYTHSVPKKPTTIIFDLSGLLFKENIANLTKKIGIRSLASYAVSHWKNPATACLGMLETMSKRKEHKPPVTLIFKEKAMPRCVVEWQQGYKTCDQVRSELNNYIEQMAHQNHFKNMQEKNLIKHIVNIIFDAQQFTDLTKPIIPIIDLAKQLKKSGYQLLLLANVPIELYNMLKATYPEVIALFDGSIISCQTHILKPDKRMFEELLNTYQLNPNQCVLIDEKEENAVAAQELGITSIVYKKRPILIKKLKQLGIIINN